MAYTPFNSGSGTAAPAKPKGGGYTSFFGNTVQKTQAQGGDKPKPSKQQDYAAQAKVAATTQAKAQQKAEADKPKRTLFDKAKGFVKDTAVAALHTGEKTANTVAAGVGSVAGFDKALAQRAIGDKKGSQETLNKTSKTADAILDKGVGGQGGFLKSKQANSSGKGIKGVAATGRSIAQGATEIAPYVVPTAKGASLLSRAAKDATAQFIVGAGQNAATQALDTGKVNVGEVAKAGGTNALLSAGASAVHAGAVKVKGKAKGEAPQPAVEPKPIPEQRADLIKKMQNDTKPGDIIANQRAVDALEPNRTPQPGTVIRPTKDEVTDLIGRANIEHPVFQQTMGGVAKDLGLKYSAGPVKDAERSLTKVMDDYHGDHTLLKDTVRGTIEVPDHSKAGFQKVIDKIKEKYPDAQIKDGYKDFNGERGAGYADMKVTVKTPGGHTAEIILATPEMLEAKNKLGGHTLYEISRDKTRTDAEREAADVQMKTLYGNAHDAANKRLASSGDLPYTDSKTRAASASDTGAPAPSRTEGKRSDLPDTTTVSRTQDEPGSGVTANTTSSSVTKNLTGDGESVIPTTIAKKTEKVKHNPNNSRVYERLQAEHPELNGQAKYTPIRLKEEADKAAKLIETDKQQAYRIAMGAEVSDEITSSATNIALAEKALQDGNTTLYAQLVKNRSLRLTRFGQEISAEKGSITDNSTGRYVEELIKNRLNKLGKNYLQGVEVGEKKLGQKSKGIAVLDREVAKAQAKLKAKTIDIKDAQSILDKISC